MSAKVVVIGLDGGTPELLQRYELPALSSLKEEGAWGTLKSIVPPVTAPAWVSFLTGKNPGKHGVFEFMHRRENSYRISPVNSTSNKSSTFIDHITSEGKRSIMINVPVTYPPQPLAGLCITGLLTPGTDSDYTYPAGLKEEIRQKVGEYTICSDEIYVPGQEERFLASLEDQVKRRTDLALYLLENYQWDFFMIVYGATDTVQHGLWGYIDPASHNYSLPSRPQFSGGIERIYQAVDGQIARLRRALPPETNTIVMSDHGAGPLYWFMHVNVFLLKKGYLKIKTQPFSLLKLMLFRIGLTLQNVYCIAYRLGVGRSRKALDAKRTKRNLLASCFLSFKDVDWKRTVAYSRGYIGQIFLNVRGREPQGIVEPGEEYQGLRERIINDLKALTRPDSSQKMIESIFPSESIYHGPYLGDAPDITFLTKRLEAVAFGNFEFTSNRPIEKAFTGISGHHRMEGVYILSGPAFQKQGNYMDLSILDLAPLILHLLGLPRDEEMDGSVPFGVLTEQYAKPVQVSFQKQTRDYGNSRELNNKDKGRIVNRLKGLGYLG